MDKKINCGDLTSLYQQSFVENWDLPGFSDYRGSVYTYGDAARLIRRMHVFFEQCQLSAGDKVALLGRNSANWGITFLAVITYGAVAVPVLPDFNPDSVHHIVRHSDARFLFVTDLLFQRLSLEEMPDLEAVIYLNQLTPAFVRTPDITDAWEQSKTLSTDLSADTFRLKKLPENAVCIISYTSGTSGFTKGVMLSVKNLFSNIIYARDHMPLKAGDRIVSFLPMAHVFGLLFEFLFPATLGCHITFLTKSPTPPVVMAAFSEIRPHLILSVPLVIEKIYTKQILPALKKPLIRFFMHIPGISAVLKKRVKEKLIEAFGGHFHEIVIGGAALGRDVELFFRKINFPFTVGYGMTECAPLIAYAAWDISKPFSAGKLVDGMQIRIDSADPCREVGEILVKGDHVMIGYYKDEEATRQAVDKEGWLHTGDLGIIDGENYIFIKGRSKNMLLGASGQNIYPEEIEIRLSNLPFISECVVVDRDGKLVARVFADAERMQEQHIQEEQLLRIMEDNRKQANRDLPKYSQISRIELVPAEFEKTPKRNIKRYLYI